MRLSLHEVLAIVGRLDDTPGYDTPRERFRRFLIEHMTSAPVARTFLDEAQQLIAEQYQRALQDTVLAAGRLLGFETTFGEYERHGGAARTAGRWLSPRRLAVTVHVWSDGASTDIAAIGRALDAPLHEAEAGTPHTLLSVVSPSCGSRPRIEDAIAARHRPTRVVSVRALMDLASLASTGLVTHDDVLHLLNPSPALEASVGLIARLAHPSRSTVSSTSSAGIRTPPREPACWVYVVREHEPGSPESGGVSDTLPMSLPAGETPAFASGDPLAFLVPARGVVAHAQVAEVVEDSTGEVDQALVRFTLHLKNMVILSPPAPVDTEQRLNLELQAAVSQEPCVRVGRGEFEGLTRVLPAVALAPGVDVG